MSEQAAEATQAPVTEAPDTTTPLEFKLDAVNLTTLNAALKEAGIKVTAKTKVEERVKLLQAYELEQCPDDNKKPEAERELGDCTVCNGVSQLKRPACPYCGTAEEQPSPVAPVANPPPKSAKEAKAKTADKPKATIAKASDGKISKKNVDEINGIERRIKGLLADSVESHWTVGRELGSVLKGGQWKYRADDEGKPAFKAFGDWVHETFGITPQYARQLVAVSEAYTVKQVREIGVKKLAISLRLPEEVRAEVVAKAAGGATVKEVEAEVQRIAPGGTRAPIERNDSLARPHQTTKNAAANKPKPTRTPKAHEVTAVLALQRYELPMFARAKSTETEEPVRAKTIAAGPQAILDLQNGVQIHVRIVEDETGISTVLEFKRVGAEAEVEPAAE